MDYLKNLISEIAEVECSKLVSKIIKNFQSRSQEGLSGDDSGLKDLWEEICVQVQGEESIFWDLYMDEIENAIEYEVEELPAAMLKVIWLQTDNGYCFEGEENDQEDFSVKQDVIDLIESKVLSEAEDFSNERIERHKKQYCEDYTDEDEDEDFDEDEDEEDDSLDSEYWYEDLEYDEFDQASAFQRYIDDLKKKIVGTEITSVMVYANISSTNNNLDENLGKTDLIDVYLPFSIQFHSLSLDIWFTKISEIKVELDLFTHDECFISNEEYWREFNSFFPNIINHKVIDIVLYKRRTNSRGAEGDYFDSFVFIMDNGYQLGIIGRDGSSWITEINAKGLV